MAIDYSVLPLSKGKTRKQLKAKKDRAESKVKRNVRQLVDERDGYCRLAGTTLCDGTSQWAHLERFKRARTRNQAPERRHSMFGSAKLCMKHHDDYDDGKIKMELGPDGANGDIKILVDGQMFLC